MTTRPIGRCRRAAATARVAALGMLACAALVAARAFCAELDVATDTPSATVESLHRGLVALSRDRPGAGLAERYRTLEPLIDKTHDLPYIAEFALRRQWPMLSEAERARFVASFEKLSVMTYASRFKNVTPDTFKTMASDAAPAAGASEPGRAQIRTAIVRQGEKDISLDYLLQQEDGSWRIINIIADGVSDLALKRAEYQRILASGSIDDLIKYVDEQTARLEQK